MLRAFVLLILLTALAWWLHGQQQQGQFRQVDEAFLDFLLANTRDELQADPVKASEVVLISLREADKADYEAWPPLPIDYQMILKALAPSEPRMLAITQPLHWAEPKPPFLDQLAESLLTLPSVVLAAGAATEGSADGSVLAFAKDQLPLLTRVQGPKSLLPIVLSVPVKPEPALLRQADVGLSLPGSRAIAMRVGESVVPSADLQILAHATRTPFSRVRLTTGPGAGLHLGDEMFVPLSRDVSLPAAATAVAEMNAVDLITAAVTGEDAETAKTLGKNKMVVLGFDDEATRQRVQSLAAALSLPRLRALGFFEQVTAWSIAGLLALSWLWLPRQKAILRAALFLFLALTGSYLAFQTGRLWCPPAIPAALLVTGGLLARLFGRASPQPPELS